VNACLGLSQPSMEVQAMQILPPASYQIVLFVLICKASDMLCQESCDIQDYLHTLLSTVQQLQDAGLSSVMKALIVCVLMKATSPYICKILECIDDELIPLGPYCCHIVYIYPKELDGDGRRWFVAMNTGTGSTMHNHALPSDGDSAYQFTRGKRYAVFQSPFQVYHWSNTDSLLVDVDYIGNHHFPYLF